MAGGKPARREWQVSIRGVQGSLRRTAPGGNSVITYSICDLWARLSRWCLDTRLLLLMKQESAFGYQARSEASRRLLFSPAFNGRRLIIMPPRPPKAAKNLKRVGG